MSADTPSAPIFYGSYRHAFDGKNRITIPSRWRRKEADEFFLVPSRTGTFLRVMPPAKFQAAAEEAKARIAPKDLSVFLRHFYSSSQHVELDKQGRLLMPEEFCESLKLRGEIMLIGTLDSFEMWSREAWNATQHNEAEIYNRVSEEVGL